MLQFFFQSMGKSNYNDFNVSRLDEKLVNVSNKSRPNTSIMRNKSKLVESFLINKKDSRASTILRNSLQLRIQDRIARKQDPIAETLDSSRWSSVDVMSGNLIFDDVRSNALYSDNRNEIKNMSCITIKMAF